MKLLFKLRDDCPQQTVAVGHRENPRLIRLVRSPARYGAPNEIVSRDSLLPRARESARHLKKQNALTLRCARIALCTRLHRRMQESLSYGLALEGISAAQVAASNASPGDRSRPSAEPDDPECSKISITTS